MATRETLAEYNRKMTNVRVTRMQPETVAGRIKFHHDKGEGEYCIQPGFGGQYCSALNYNDEIAPVESQAVRTLHDALDADGLADVSADYEHLVRLLRNSGWTAPNG